MLSFALVNPQNLLPEQATAWPLLRQSVCAPAPPVLLIRFPSSGPL